MLSPKNQTENIPDAEAGPAAAGAPLGTEASFESPLPITSLMSFPFRSLTRVSAFCFSHSMPTEPGIKQFRLETRRRPFNKSRYKHLTENLF